MRVNPTGFEAFDLKLHPPGELISDVITRTGSWEPFESEVMGRLLRAGDCVVDVGANIGYYTKLAMQRVGAEGKVLAFEPDVENFALLQANVGRNGFCYRAALSDRSGSGFLSRDEENKGDLYVRASSGERIELLRGDDLRLSRINILKIDTQGSEIRVLEGLKETIARSRQDLSILIEFWPFGLKRLGDSARVLVDLLLALGLPLFRVDHEAGCLARLDEGGFQELALGQLTVEHRGFVNLLLTNRSVG